LLFGGETGILREGKHAEKDNRKQIDMGHSTAIQTITLEEIPKPEPRTSRSFYGSYNQSLEERILSTAVARWYDEEANRWDSANPGSAKMLKPVPEELSGEVMDKHFAAEGYNVSPVIPIISEKDYEIKTKTIIVKLVDEEWAEYLKNPYYHGILSKKVNELVPELKNVVVGFSVVKDGKANPYSYNPSEGWTVRSSIDADTSGGKAVTVYRLLVDGKGFTKDEYPSQAAARAAGIALMEKDINLQKVEVIPKIVREDGTALVKLTRRTKQATAKVTVNYIKMKTDKPTVVSYVTAFDYHH
jgi:hypothetical protein